MHHKRGRPKNRRAGCLFCKPHKANGAKKVESAAVLRRTQDAIEIDIEEVEEEDDDYDFEYMNWYEWLSSCAASKV